MNEYIPDRHTKVTLIVVLILLKATAQSISNESSFEINFISRDTNKSIKSDTHKTNNHRCIFLNQCVPKWKARTVRERKEKREEREGAQCDSKVLVFWTQSTFKGRISSQQSFYLLEHPSVSFQNKVKLDGNIYKCFSGKPLFVYIFLKTDPISC